MSKKVYTNYETREGAEYHNLEIAAEVEEIFCEICKSYVKLTEARTFSGSKGVTWFSHCGRALGFRKELGLN